MAQQGESASYYTGAPQQPHNAYYQGQPNYGPPQQQYRQQPPQYGQNYAAPQGPPPQHQNNGYMQQGYGDNKMSFEQTFKVDKPKYNDLWAGALFIAVFLGYVAVSAISIRGYCEYTLVRLVDRGRGVDSDYFAAQNNSGGIYGNANQFALNSNTVILFAFVLGMAVVFSYAYLWAARAFTKQFIWITGILNIVFWVRNGALHALEEILVWRNRLSAVQHILCLLFHFVE